MKSVFLTENNLDMMWFSLLSELYKHGRRNKIDYGSYAGAERLEFDFAAGTIEHPSTRPLAPIVPEGVSPPTTNDKIEEYFTNYIMDGHNLESNEHYRYATWISGGKYILPKANVIISQGMEDDGSISKFGFKGGLMVNVPNQVEWVIGHYKDKGFGNNHGWISIGYPESNFAYDISFKTEADRQTSPCLRGIDTHVKDNMLHMAVVFRSWDLWGGFPMNMGGMVHLMEYIANELEIEMGPLSFSCLKLHTYDFHIESVKARLKL